MLDAPPPSRRDARASLDSPRRRARREAEAAAQAQLDAEAAVHAQREAAQREAAQREAAQREAAVRAQEELAARHRQAAAAAVRATQELPVLRERPAAGTPAPVPAWAPAPAPPARVDRRTPPPEPAAPRRTAARAPLPWHLRRSFLLPVVGVCLLGSLSCLVLLGIGYANVRATGGRLSDIVLSASDSQRAAPAASSTTTRRPGGTNAGTTAGVPSHAPAAAVATPVTAGPVTTPTAAEPTATAPPATAPSSSDTTDDAQRGQASQTTPRRSGSAAPEDRSSAGTGRDTADSPSTAPAGPPQTVSGDVTYEGFGTAKAASVDYTVDGEFDGTSAGGATFSLPQRGSKTWKGWYVSVTATDGGQAGCRIRDAGGRVLVQARAVKPGDTAECAWGEQGDGVPQDDGPATEDPGDS